MTFSSKASHYAAYNMYDLLPARLRHVLHGSDRITTETLHRGLTLLSTEDKSIYIGKDRCVVVRRRSPDGMLEVYPNLATAYYQLVQKRKKN